ncbi:hypothetical protein WHR41_06130 [Cladosporium halotolerans]|uniref:GAR domain-containing protein n=1 Tax=Cladosporium halotolerans TaxID=1052096 RepID=A0AB34KMI4_9PEZI
MDGGVPLTLANPAAHAPGISSPTRRQLISRSPSRSSSRLQFAQPRDTDPVLRSLSPTTTLRAFAEASRISADDALHAALQDSSPAQRNLGARAAQTCLDVRSWAREMEGWEWSGTFDVPEPTRKRQRLSTMSTGSLSREVSTNDQEIDDSEYWGSLPAKTVREYEQRWDEIAQQLDEIDMEELKEFALSAHNQAGTGAASIDDSIGAIGAATDLRKLDDFTAIVTATIMQTLPFLSRLNSMLTTWRVRLAILRQAPLYLKLLWQARADLDQGWGSLANLPIGGENLPRPAFTRGDMIELKSRMEHDIGKLGMKLDRFLDDLEGRPETVPESWIEELESMEQNYAEWTIRAERKILEDDLRKNRWSKRLSSAAQTRSRSFRSSTMPESPVNGLANGHNGGDAGAGVRSPIERTNDIGSALSPPIEGREPSPAPTFDLMPPPIPELARNDSNTIPSAQADHIIEPIPRASTAASRRSSRSRHVPIILPYVGDGQKYPSEGITGDSSSPIEPPASDLLPEPAKSNSEVPALSVAKRRAFFTGDIERTQSLQRATKTPVRPFEHASNAFARLFKQEGAPSPERSRSTSLRSEIRRRSGSGKSENGVIWGGRTPASPKSSIRRKTSEGSSRDLSKDRGTTPKADPVAADADAPPVPVLPAPDLPPKSPRRSLQSPAKIKSQSSTPASPNRGQKKAEPFPEFDFGENWPLSPPESIYERGGPVDAQTARLYAQASNESTGMTSPKKPMESDSFHRMFVDSLPGTPDERSESPALVSDLPASFPEPPKSRLPVRSSVVPTVESFMLENSPGSVFHAQFQEESVPASSVPVTERPQHIDLPADSSLPLPTNASEDPKTPNSITSDTYSPEIQDARVSYFQMASPSLSRANSVATTSPQQNRPRSSYTMSSMQLQDPPQEDEEGANQERINESLQMRRASKMSIGSQNILEVKSIDLSPRKSSASPMDHDVQPIEDALGRPPRREEEPAFPTPPAIHEERPRTPVSPLAGSPGPSWLKHKTSNLSVVSKEASPAAEIGALNSFMGKRRGPATQQSDLSPPSFELKPESDTFDRQVSKVLQKIPASIRFRTGATTPQPRAADPRSYGGPRPKNNPRAPSRTSTNPGALTLAPADPSPSRRHATANEPEVKLYHLTQAGREEPIKLFVRLVGEGERVMVRVGGGWADLADYLRQYAEHHGSRTVSASAGDVDVKAVSSPIAGPNGAIHPALRRQASGPLFSAASGRRSPMPPTPPQVQGENLDPSAAAAMVTPDRPAIPAKSASRPSTADSNLSSGKHSSPEIGLAGFGSGGKRELPEQKARWVEGMVERVQNAGGGEQKGQKQKGFTELGTVGGTRRVVFRNAGGA